MYSEITRYKLRILILTDNFTPSESPATSPDAFIANVPARNLVPGPLYLCRDPENASSQTPHQKTRCQTQEHTSVNTSREEKQTRCDPKIHAETQWQDFRTCRGSLQGQYAPR